MNRRHLMMERELMTVFVCVNTSMQVGDADHVKVITNVDAAERWFEENVRKA
jgi:hypothetical protein